jgi:hypothetical protein
MNRTMTQPRSLFWPLTLIAVGVLWLLISLGLIPAANLWALTHLWPLGLIALGVGVLLSWKWQWAARIVTILVIAAAVLAVIFAPQLGWASPNLINIGGEVGGAVRGSGIITTETREISGLRSLLIEYPAEVVIRQGATESLTIEGDNNLLPQLRSQVQFGELRFGNDEPNWQARVSPTHTVRLTLTVKDLREVNFSSAGTLRIEGLTTDTLTVGLQGAGEVTLSNLQTQRLECNQSGAGNITVSGTTESVRVRISGLGNFEAPDLKTETADLRLSGAGNATVWVIEDLTLDISGAGSVRYYGSPAVHERISGAGSAQKLGDK